MKETQNIFIIGQGATASALAKKLAQDEHVNKIFVTPQNTILNNKIESIDIREDDLTGLLRFALENDVNLTIPISSKALKSDIVSFFMDNDQNIFGPTKDACHIMTNKAVGKKFLYKIHAQTSKFGVFDKIQQAEDFIGGANFPILIKSPTQNDLDDRLVCNTKSLASEFLEVLFNKNNETGILIEEFTIGHNFTIYFITDGYSALPLNSVANYKFMQDGDGGLLTSGMGCYTPDYKITDTVLSRVQNVANNMLSTLDKKGTPYIGIFGIDCTLTGDDKFYINEFHPFLQDSDATSILNTIKDDLIEIFMACITGLFADEYENIDQNNLSSVSAVVLSRQNYKVIDGIELIDDINNIDFCNIKESNDGKYLTNQGKAFVLTRNASTITRAKNLLYDDLEQISFEGIKYRRDIAKES
ncbi:MAG: hypothetical protein E7Z87_04925 [Cyanobacteria bacterium SIG26]|nr:hypothetical protein [Cyanobacteria bacterium SIG26]